MLMPSTYTFAELAVSKSTYEDVRARMLKATEHESPPRYNFKTPDEPLDMHGIALIIDWGEEAGKTAAKAPEVKVSKRKPRKLLKSEVWAADVAKAKDAIATIRAKLDELSPEFQTLNDAFAALETHKDDYAERLGNIPESLSNGEHAERLRAIDDLDLGDFEDVAELLPERLTELGSVLDECENAELPKD